MPSVNINSKDFKDLGISLKDFLKIVKNSGDNKNEEPIIIKKKKKRKNRRINKRLKKLVPLQNNKPNFGHQNQIGGGGGGIGGTSYNPLAQQRSAPAVTTVVNTPPTGGQNDKQIANLEKNIEGSLYDTMTLIRGVANHSYRNMSQIANIQNYLGSNNPLTELQQGSFRQPEYGANKNDRYGIIPQQQPQQQQQQQQQDDYITQEPDEEQQIEGVQQPIEEFEQPVEEEFQQPVEEYQQPSEEGKKDYSMDNLEIINEEIINDLNTLRYNIDEEFKNSSKTPELGEYKNKINYFLSSIIDEGDKQNLQDIFDTIEEKFARDQWGELSEDAILELVYNNLSGLMKEYEKSKLKSPVKQREPTKKIDPVKTTSTSKRDPTMMYANDYVDEDEDNGETLEQQLERESKEADEKRQKKAEEDEKKAREIAENWFNSGKRPRGGISKRANEIYNQLKSQSPLVAESLQKLKAPTNQNSPLVSNYPNTRLRKKQQEESDFNEVPENALELIMMDENLTKKKKKKGTK